VKHIMGIDPTSWRLFAMKQRPKRTTIRAKQWMREQRLEREAAIQRANDIDKAEMGWV